MSDGTALILAAGASSRMGRSKALLPLGKGTFLETILQTWGEGAPRQEAIVVVSSEGDEARLARHLGARVALNPGGGGGMLGSIWKGLEAMRGQGGVLLWPVDHPLVLASTISALCGGILGHPERILLPCHGGRRGHPAAFGRELLVPLKQASPDEGARAVVRDHREQVVELPVEDPGVWKDIDTPALYREWIRAKDEARGGSLRGAPLVME